MNPAPLYKNLRWLGYPDYEVGTDGSVWSKFKKEKWIKLKPFVNDKHGTRCVTLHNGVTKITIQVSHLVLKSFVGPRPKGMIACHYPDRDPSNNSTTNLRWGTWSNNTQDAVKHGTNSLIGHKHMSGSNHPRSVFTDDEVRKIRRLRKKGLKYSTIAKRVNAAHWAVRRAGEGQTYSNVE